MDDLQQEFIAESQEGLERMELCLTDLEIRPNEGELVAEIFRAVHTIKGATGFLGFTRLQELAHKGESLLAALRDGLVSATPALISGLLALMYRLREILRLIEKTGTEGERSTDEDKELIEELVRLRADDSGGLAEGSDEKVVAGQERDTQGLKPHSSCGNHGTDKSVPLTNRAFSSPSEGGVNVHPVAATRGPTAGVEDVSASQRRTLRIDVDVLNRMMNQVGELVLTRNHILQSAPGAENFAELARRLNNVTGELRQTVMQARMQPAGHLFSKFPQLVRSLGKTCGRQVRLEFEGQDTELDKSLLEAVRDPLTHAVRNAVDHGIEPPEDRVLAGKPMQGVVRLRAFHQGGSVVIEVIDDGAGICRKRVLEKAVERGLITAARSSAMSDHEALQMIFVAGFSTAAEVTSVSGRGVGMDVVRTNLVKVGGDVEVESHEGAGTTVRMRLPLTLAIVSALVVRSGDQNFVLPQSSLVELVYLHHRERESALEQVGSAELYRLREKLLPLVRLDRVLGLKQSAANEARNLYIAVVEAGGMRFGLMVDDLKAPEEIVVKPLSAVLREIGMFSGATVLGNGVLALILDVAALGAHAGVRVEVESSPGVVKMPEETMEATQSSMVIYETWKAGAGGPGRAVRMGMPLSEVERIKRVALSDIEWADGRAVLQYDGELLPLEDDDGVLVDLEAVSVSGEAPGMVTILICAPEAGRPQCRAGVVVRKVIDVAAGTLLDADTSVYGSVLAMVKSRVTTLHRPFAGVKRGYQEVA